MIEFNPFYLFKLIKCDPILENQPYRGIIDFEIWLYKVIAGVVGQK